MCMCTCMRMCTCAFMCMSMSMCLGTCMCTCTCIRRRSPKARQKNICSRPMTFVTSFGRQLSAKRRQVSVGSQNRDQRLPKKKHCIPSLLWSPQSHTGLALSPSHILMPVMEGALQHFVDVRRHVARDQRCLIVRTWALAELRQCVKRLDRNAEDHLFHFAGNHLNKRVHWGLHACNTVCAHMQMHAGCICYEHATIKEGSPQGCEQCVPHRGCVPAGATWGTCEPCTQTVDSGLARQRFHWLLLIGWQFASAWTGFTGTHQSKPLASYVSRVGLEGRVGLPIGTSGSAHLVALCDPGFPWATDKQGIASQQYHDQHRCQSCNILGVRLTMNRRIWRRGSTVDVCQPACFRETMQRRTQGEYLRCRTPHAPTAGISCIIISHYPLPSPGGLPLVALIVVPPARRVTYPT